MQNERAEIRGVVFDMDGVLFDSEPLHMVAWRDILCSHGHTYEMTFFDDWIGIPDETLGRHLEEKHSPAGVQTGFLQEKRGRFRDLVRERLQPFDGLPQRLADLAARMPLGVATSSQRADLDLMLEVTGTGGHFAATVCVNDIDRPKPDPQIYCEAARRIGVAPEACAAIEDSPSGIRAALAAGMTVLAVTNSFPADQLPETEYVFPSTVAACDWILAQQ